MNVAAFLTAACTADAFLFCAPLITRPPTALRIPTNAIEMSPTVMITSMRVNPPSERVDPGSACPMGRDLLAKVSTLDHAVDRLDHRHRDEPDDHAHEHDDGGLEQRHQLLQLVLELARVVLGRDLELVVEITGLFADVDHLYSGDREDSG